MKWPRRRRNDDQDQQPGLPPPATPSAPPPVPPGPPRPPSGALEEVLRSRGRGSRPPAGSAPRDAEPRPRALGQRPAPEPDGRTASGPARRPAPVPKAAPARAALADVNSGAGDSGETAIAVRFATATSALVFTGRLAALGRPQAGDHRRSVDGSSWWVFTHVALDLGRQLATAADGTVFLVRSTQLVRDQGWGDPERVAGRRSAQRLPLASLRPATLFDLVRRAGLYSVPGRALDDAVVLLRAEFAGGVIRRALDLGLEVTYRPTRLTPLFDDEPSDPAQHGVVLELALRAPHGDLPAGFLDALHRDPFTLLCRRVGGEDTVLMQYRQGSALSDGPLLELAERGVWLLSGSEFGCARLERLGEPLDGGALVELAADYPLQDVGASPDWADDAPTAPEAPRLTVVPARTSGATVDATLLDGTQLDTVRMMLEGHPLADAVQVVTGRDQHLLLAAGGLLERLPLGEPLHCTGPGPLYIPLGFRTEPLLPPSALEALFEPDADRAVVLTAHAALVFDLTRRRPAWTLWVGPLPEPDLQLPDEAEAVLRVVDERLTPKPKPRPAEPPRLRQAQPPGSRPRHAGTGSSRRPRHWRDTALDAEFAGDLVRAAEIHEHNGDALRAANLYERAARQAAGRRW
ncbi:hypothetical protein [Streptomyces spiramyceticus]|uniref:hypothetical protein n=1 Tax=Streptomyces spiramyceticus TaxID=299717 RepID=UPI00237BDD44|nr:hypothetical protein [Streptomyces spiramyceticus]